MGIREFSSTCIEITLVDIKLHLARAFFDRKVSAISFQNILVLRIQIMIKMFRHGYEIHTFPVPAQSDTIKPRYFVSADVFRYFVYVVYFV